MLYFPKVGRSRISKIHHDHQNHQYHLTECDVPVPGIPCTGKKSSESVLVKFGIGKKSCNRYRKKSTGIGSENILYWKKYWYT